MAMNIISKEKKEIKWLGLPTNSVQEANGLEVDKTRRIERIKAKTQQLQDLILQVSLILITATTFSTYPVSPWLTELAHVRSNGDYGCLFNI